MTAPTAICLVSGGLDSTTTLGIALAENFDPLPLAFRYGQRHAVEIDAAIECAKALGARAPLILDLPFDKIGGSALLGAGGDIPVDRGAPERLLEPREVPTTYVPARNLVFLSTAIAVAESRGAREIFLGVNALDYSGYPDCRPPFIESFQRTANLGTRDGTEGNPFRVHTPLIGMTKADIIRRADALGIDLSKTVSCYDPDADGRACGKCEACGLRRRGFEEAGVVDVTRYR